MCCFMASSRICIHLRESESESESESEEEDKNKDKKTRALIYITFMTIFYVSQYIYEFIDDDYNKNYKPSNIYEETENNKKTERNSNV